MPRVIVINFLLRSDANLITAMTVAAMTPLTTKAMINVAGADATATMKMMIIDIECNSSFPRMESTISTVLSLDYFFAFMCY